LKLTLLCLSPAHIYAAPPPPARLFHIRTQYAAPPAESGKMTALDSSLAWQRGLERTQHHPQPGRHAFSGRRTNDKEHMTTVPKEINAAAAKKNSAEKLTPMMQQCVSSMRQYGRI
jgi:hypothetical protein